MRHQTGVQYSAVECTKARVAIRRVVAPAPQPDPASRLRSATRDVSFLRSDSRCRWFVSDLSNVTQRYWARNRRAGFRCCIWSDFEALLYLTSTSRLASLFRWKAADTAFVVLRFSFKVCRYSPTVAMSLVRTPSTACQSHQHAWLLGYQQMQQTFWRWWLVGQRYRCWREGAPGHIPFSSTSISLAYQPDQRLTNLSMISIEGETAETKIRYDWVDEILASLKTCKRSFS